MAVFAQTHPGTVPHRGGFLHWIFSGAGLTLLVLILSVLSRANQPSTVSCVPPQCGAPPPQQSPAPALDHYTSSRFGFSLDYSSSNISPSQVTDSSISWDGMLSDGSEVTWSVMGSGVNGQTAQQVVDDYQTANLPDAQSAYVIPGAEVGYTPGYGSLYDVDVAPGGGQAVHDRLVVMAAIRGSVAVVVAGLGPYEQSSPSNSGHPNPAATPLVELGDFAESTETVTWPGEPPL